jgi:hypothetical protein
MEAIHFDSLVPSNESTLLLFLSTNDQQQQAQFSFVDVVFRVMCDGRRRCVVTATDIAGTRVPVKGLTAIVQVSFGPVYRHTRHKAIGSFTGSRMCRIKIIISVFERCLVCRSPISGHCLSHKT